MSARADMMSASLAHWGPNTDAYVSNGASYRWDHMDVF
jgi:hypothetical protein